MITKSQIKFHETFQPELLYISKILVLASENYSGNKFEISEITGIPTGKQKGKVEPNIKYAKYMGLVECNYTNGQYSLHLTKLGREVFAQDKYLFEIVTKWICHYGISRLKEGAPQWSFLINNLKHNYNDRMSCQFMLKQANDFWGLSADFEDVFGVVRRSYTAGCFEDLNYARWDESLSFNEITYKSELLYLYAYALLDTWEKVLGDKKEITFSELQGTLHWDAIFGLHDEEINNILDELSDAGYLAVNRQLFPTTIIRLSSSDEMITSLYNNLL